MARTQPADVLSMTGQQHYEKGIDVLARGYNPANGDVTTTLAQAQTHFLAAIADRLAVIADNTRARG